MAHFYAFLNNMMACVIATIIITDPSINNWCLIFPLFLLSWVTSSKDKKTITKDNP